MSFIAKEISEYDGLPQEGFLFEYLTESWTYTTSKQSIVINTDTYSPTYIKRSSLRNEFDMFKTTLTITLAADDPVALKFRTWMETTMIVTVFRQHYTDSDAVVLWSGKVASCKWTGNEVELDCIPLYSSLKVIGLLRTYQRSCPHVQYGNSCLLDPAIWRDAVTITNISDTLIEFSGSYAVSYFTSGSITIGHERRMVTASSGGSVTAMDNFVDAKIGDTAYLLPGCRHSADICRNTFNNELNNGGFYFIPRKNPFMVTLLG